MFLYRLFCFLLYKITRVASLFTVLWIAKTVLSKHIHVRRFSCALHDVIDEGLSPYRQYFSHLTAWCERQFNWIYFVCLFGFLRPSREFFYSFGVFTITAEELLILIYTRHSWPLTSWGSLARHTYCDTGHEANALSDASPLVKGTKQIQRHSRALVYVFMSFMK